MFMKKAGQRSEGADRGGERLRWQGRGFMDDCSLYASLYVGRDVPKFGVEGRIGITEQISKAPLAARRSKEIPFPENHIRGNPVSRRRSKQISGGPSEKGWVPISRHRAVSEGAACWEEIDIRHLRKLRDELDQARLFLTGALDHKF